VVRGLLSGGPGRRLYGRYRRGGRNLPLGKGTAGQ
jgi:hypothetical protein